MGSSQCGNRERRAQEGDGGVEHVWEEMFQLNNNGEKEAVIPVDGRRMATNVFIDGCQN